MKFSTLHFLLGIMENENLIWTPDALAITCLLISMFVMFVVLLVQLKKKNSFETKLSAIHVEKDNIIGRPLGKMETVFHNLHKEGNLQVSMAALAKTLLILENHVILKVLQHLVRKHPILQMSLTEKDGQPYFVPGNKEIPFATVSSGNWQDIFEEGLTTRLDETKCLWRLMMVEPYECPIKDQPRKVAFLFTFHHSIGDGLCKTRFVTEFIECLNKVLQGKCLKDERYSVLPPLDFYMKPILERSSSESFLFEALNKLPRDSSLLQAAQKKYLASSQQKENKFIEQLGAVCLDSPAVKARTCMIPLKFTKVETDDIVKACRRRDATVHGMLTAAASITMNDLFDDTASLPSEKQATIPVRTTVNMRRYLNKKVPESYIGSYFVGLFGQEIPIPKRDSPVAQFWTCAQETSQNLKRQIQEKNFITKFWNLLETVYHTSKAPKTTASSSSNKPETGPNRTSELLSLNNYGRCPSKGSHADLVELQSCFCAVAEHRKGPIFTINAVTVEGQLCLSFVYYTNITSRNMAVNFAESMRKKITNYASSR